MKQLVAKMRKVVADSQPNVYYDEMMAVVAEMEAALAKETVTPAPQKAKPASVPSSVEDTVAKAVSKKSTKKTTKKETSTEE